MSQKEKILKSLVSTAVEPHNEVSVKALKRLAVTSFSQDDFGMKKYNTPLKSHYNYDWLHMAVEEFADAMKYIENEIERRQLVKNFLEMGLISENPKRFIEMALTELNKTGTGK